jgi:hypothetical protein
MREFENGVLRKIVVSKRDKLTGQWRTLHNEELQDLYSQQILFSSSNRV